MKHNRRHSVLLYNILRLLLVLALLQVPGVGQAQEITIDTSPNKAATDISGDELNKAIEDALQSQLGLDPQNGFVFQIIQTEAEWVFGNIGVFAPPTEDAGPQGFVFLARTIPSGLEIGIEDSNVFLTLLSQAPISLVPVSTRAYFMDSLTAAGDGSAQLSLPWQTGETWRLTGGPHHNFGNGNRPWSALDFGGGSGVARAARGGTVYLDCANFVRIVHKDGWQTGYYHLTNIGVSNGQEISQGHYLGTTSTAANCGGSATGPHVHFTLRRNGDQQEIIGHDLAGWTVQNTNSQYEGCMKKGDTVKCKGGSNDIYSDGSSGSGGGSNTCPNDRNGVILYQHWNFDCGGKGENDGYVRRNDSGLQNVSGGFNDKATSVRVPSGWSVKLFENGDRGGGWACRTSDDDSFSDDNRFNNSVRINDNISSFEVFKDSRCGEPIPPCPAPVLNEPPPGRIFENRTIPFSWNDVSCEHNGFTFRVKTSPDMDSSSEPVIDTGEGGTSRTVTFDSRWDDKDLYWSVKAVNAPGGASWAAARHFRISPNRPPTIDFKTANGNGDSRITTRDQNWTFQGTAGDPENKFSRVEFKCDDCDNRGSGQDNSTSTNWSITRNGMSGRNYVYFEAFDDKQGTKSRTLELNIDLAAPTTDIQITGNAPYGWFTEAAQVRLTGRDNGTGRAVADVKEVHFKRDSGGEQVQLGATVNFSEGGDGVHTVRYFSVDNVGNTESERTTTYQVDRTPPTAIGGVRESHSIANDTWQKAQNRPTFAWNASSDATSGLGGYQLYFGQDANGTAVHVDVAAAASLEWTPNNLGVATGVYYLRGRTWDKAGNASAWQTLFTFKYDITPPPNPGEATHADGVKNDTWQKTTARPNFTWTAPIDEGSGVKGYSVYWGSDEKGESASFVTANSFASATPLCAVGAACTGYLRLRSQDNVALDAEEWSTTFVLRYDGAPPLAAFTVNNGVTQTAQTLITLNLNASDQGSGLAEMRFSSDGQGWTAWEAYAAQRVWEIPAISRQFWPVYAQVKDAVGLESAVVSRTVYFDVNVDRPRSASYRLFDWADVAGAGSHTSQPTGYKGHSSIGQVLDSPRITSTNYLLVGGYEAGSRAIPLVVPGHDEYEFINGIFASGVVNDTLRSAQYRLIGTAGETALPNNSTEIASASYRHQPGFLAAHPSDKDAPTPTPTPTPGPTPTPTPTPDCEFPRVSIDNGAVFTSDTAVTLSLCAPRVTEMQVSNDGGFPGALWEPYARSKPWTLTSHSNYVLPRFVYAVFKDAAGQIYFTYLDDIILDPNPPEAKVQVGTNLPLDENLLAAARAGREDDAIFQTQGVAYLWEVDGQPLAEPMPLLSASAAGGVDLYLSARDAVGNVTQMQVSDTGSFSGTWESYSALKAYTPSNGDGVKTVYARFQDEAGNASQTYTATFALDTLPPLGGIALSHPILGPDVVTTTVWLGAQDNLSGVAAMRLSTDPTFADAVWRPFASSSTWVYAQADRSRAALHVQFRDAAGNSSEVYAAPLLVDTTPPLVYVEVAAGQTFTRTVRVYSYDELTYPARMRITNDPLFLEGVVTQPYVDTLMWTFDARRVVWVQVQDGVGNWSEPYPAYVEMPVSDIRLYLPEIQSAAPGREREIAPTSALEWQVYLPALGQ